MRSKIGALLAAAAAAASAAGATVWAKRRRDEDDLVLEVTETTVGRAGPGDVGASVKADVAADDLTSLKGLGAVTAGKLAEVGTTTFAQVAAWTEEDIADVGMKINVSPGRIKREDWVGQAQARLED